jgi:hypothetical protein
MASHRDPLAPVPNQNGELPPVFPESITNLAVACNEMLVDGTRNTWNKRLSIQLLQIYGEEDATDNEDEQSSSSRRRMLRVAKKIGVTPAQITNAFEHHNLS